MKILYISLHVIYPMVQRKLVIKVQMTCDKCRTKALKLAAGAEGVTSVAIEGDDKSLVVVIGDEVDSVCLTRSLRKKVGYATIEQDSIRRDLRVEMISFHNPFVELS
ncbi:heavy metal-associated isoprenylated plant protein 47 [Quercus suber]|uniref:Heavy metal-associated isoprenylated plant protein 47 n=1 Tax=Quercus suber TaxID=58331 RepID=A0AAW0IYX2_QUESU